MYATVEHTGNARLEDTQSQANHARIFIVIGRTLLAISFLSLCSAWVTQILGRPIFGLDQQHLFFDSIALALIGIGSLFDGILHSKGL